MSLVQASTEDFAFLEPTQSLLLEPGQLRSVLTGYEVVCLGTEGMILPGPLTNEAIAHGLCDHRSRREALLGRGGRGACLCGTGRGGPGTARSLLLGGSNIGKTQPAVTNGSAAMDRASRRAATPEHDAVVASVGP